MKYWIFLDREKNSKTRKLQFSNFFLKKKNDLYKNCQWSTFSTRKTFSVHYEKYMNRMKKFSTIKSGIFQNWQVHSIEKIVFCFENLKNNLFSQFLYISCYFLSNYLELFLKNFSFCHYQYHEKRASDLITTKITSTLEKVLN